MESREKLLLLLDKYTTNTITASEHDELFHLIASGQYDLLLEEHFNAHIHDASIPPVEMHPQRAEEVMQKIRSAEKQTLRVLPPAPRKKYLLQ
jgi:hypothetical protein